MQKRKKIAVETGTAVAITKRIIDHLYSPLEQRQMHEVEEYTELFNELCEIVGSEIDERKEK